MTNKSRQKRWELQDIKEVARLQFLAFYIWNRLLMMIADADTVANEFDVVKQRNY